MDRHLAYVGMTRHRDSAEVYAGRDEFKSFEDLKQRLSRARPKDITLDYVERRGLDLAVRHELQRQSLTHDQSLASSGIDRSDAP
jgi:hypothetical protein